MNDPTRTAIMSVNKPNSHKAWRKTISVDRELGDLRGNDQDSSDHSNQGNNQEWLGQQSMFAEGNLNRIQQLNDQQDQKNLVQQIDDVCAQRGPQNRGNYALQCDDQQGNCHN